jgi:very-short-patch-repair endonuclease
VFTDLTTAFRGSSAVAAGLLTPGVLRGPRYRRLFPDVYAPSALEPDLALRARAAGVLVAGRGVVAGYAAAELHGASSGAPDDPVDVLVPHSYRCAGLRVHRGRVPSDEVTGVGGVPVTAVGGVPIMDVAGVPVTTPVRTAFDLARWASTPTERVAAVDALGQHCGVHPDTVRALRNRHLGAWQGGAVAEVLGLMDARAESPMESRTRMALRLGRLPAPAVQHPVVARGTRYYLDLAYPHVLLAIEYDGADHRGQRRARRDLLREAALTELGWKILRFDGDVVLFRPERIVMEVRSELATRAAATGRGR